VQQTPARENSRGDEKKEDGTQDGKIKKDGQKESIT
jgi:hypothetical protein